MTARPAPGRQPAALVLLAIAATAATPHAGYADEGGISFWLPGLFRSFAATPAVPGWSFATLYIHTSVATNANKSFPLGGQIVAGVKGSGNLAAFGPTYVFAEPVLGGQGSLSLLGVGGAANGSIAATLSGPLGRTVSGSFSQSEAGFGDLIPQGSLKWNHGVHNWMTYLTGDIPIGDYDATRIANLGLGHGAIDGGAGYIYFNPQTGHEFSVATGLTYNFTTRPSTTRTESISASIGGHRNSCRNRSLSGSSAISLTRSPATADPVPGSARSSRGSPDSGRKSAICSRSAACRAFSASRDMANSRRRTDPRDGTYG